MASVPRRDCAVDATMSVIEGRWKPVILCKLKHKKEMRFNHILRDVDGISPRMLAKQLKELEHDGMIVREVYNEVPPRVEYSLTERGNSIIPVLTAMMEWGLGNMFRTVIEINGK